MSKLENGASSGMTVAAAAAAAGVEVCGKRETQRRWRLTTIRDSRKTAVGEHLYNMKIGNVARDDCRAQTTVTSLDEGKPWILSRALPGFPNDGGGRFFRSDYNTETCAVAATGRLPRPSAAPLLPT